MNNPFHTLRNHVMEVVDELKRCNWPTALELRDSTVVVIVSVFILGVAIFAVDSVSIQCIRFLTLHLTK